MFRLKMAFKAAIVPAIIGLVATVLGIVLFIIGFAVDVFALVVIGFIVLSVGLACAGIAYGKGKSRMRAICPECQKFMGDSKESVEYSFVCNQYKENYDKNTHQFKDYTFYYTCTVVCPHCGNTVMFEEKMTDKSEPKANARMNEYLKGILKIKQEKEEK